MNEVPFHLTKMGRDFYDRTLPEIARQLARLNDLLDQLVRRMGPVGKED